MRSLTGFIIILGFLCAAMGAFIWSCFTHVGQEKYFYIAEPAYLNMEQDDAFFPVSKEKLPENIKSLTQKTYGAVFSESKQDFEPNEQIARKIIFYYDRNKRLIKRNIYGKDGKLLSDLVFKYNPKGERIADENGESLLTYATYNYNEKGNMAGWNNYNNEGGLISSATLKYDDKNKLIEEFRQNASDKGREKYIYNYKGTGQKMSRMDYSSADYLSKTYAYIYNEQGKLMEWIQIRRNGYVDEREVYSYDSNGNLNEKISYLSGSYLRDKKIYRYDNKGNKIEELMFIKPDSPFYKRSYNYNTENKLMEQLGYSIWIDPISKKERISSVSERSVFEYEFYPANEKK